MTPVRRWRYDDCVDTTLMPLIDGPVETIAIAPARKRWTRAQCEALDASGLLAGEHVELIDGELINKMGKNQPHVIAVAMISAWLREIFGYAHVLQEAPIAVSSLDNVSNEPEPDIIVVTKELGAYQSNCPTPSDLLLVIEVSDSTLYLDLKTKASLYARAGIADFWVLDVNARRLIVHRNPNEGEYTAIHVYREQEPVSPLAAPQAEFRAQYAFPPK